MYLYGIDLGKKPPTPKKQRFNWWALVFWSSVGWHTHGIYIKTGDYKASIALAVIMCAIYVLGQNSHAVKMGVEV